MSQIITVDLARAGDAPIPAFPLQIDLMNQQDAKAYAGAQPGDGPFFRYVGITIYPVVLLQGDKLTDRNNIDPKTSANTVYRIIGDPEVFDDHTECVLDRTIGT